MTPERDAEIERICHAALERDAASRAAFLDEACADDAVLRREIESLLAQEPAAAGFMSAPALALAGDVLGGGTSFIGRQLGPYTIQARLGVGGMGEVYQAHDTKLGRHVAIKVLPELFARDPDRLSRFQREAKMLATLNHPAIATIYGLEQSDGISYLVMELVSGETLQQRLARKGRLPIEDALGLCRQIAEALEAAHEKGIIHRDLKPANVKVTPEGRVKVLDFGLAKAFAADGTRSDPTQSPTLSIAATAQGVILGTAAYMSPEQARGKAVDKRTDIWAFGCVLYELLTGKQAFQGEMITEILAAVLKEEPDWQLLPEVTPQNIRVLLRRSVRKDVNQRCRDVGDMRIEIEDALTASPAPEPTITTLTKVPHRILRRWAMASGLVCLTVAALTGWAVWSLRFPAPTGSPAVRSTILLPANLIGALPSSRLTLSPDGRRVAFVAPNENGRAVLWVRALDGLTAQPLAGTEGGQAPFWSPDSRFLAFFADNKLKKIDASGGPALVLCDAFFVPNAVPGAWSQDDVILFNASTNFSPLSRVVTGGGTASVVTTLDTRAGEAGHTLPWFLPDGQHFLYGATTSGQRALGVYVGSLNSTARTRLLEGVSHARYAQGHLLFLRGTTLMAQPFDPTRLVLSGEAVPVADQVQTDPAWRGAFAVSDTGVVAYQAGSSPSRLLWFDRAGKQTGVLSDRANYDDVFLSRDGTRASVSVRESGTASRSIWTVDVASGRRTRFTFDAGEQFEAPWSFDGSQRVFNSPRKGHLDLYLKSSSGAGTEEELLADDVDKYPQSLSPDGRFLMYMVFGASTGQDLRILPLTGERKPFDFRATPDNDGGGQFSPDGRWIAYWSNATGRQEVVVAPFRGSGGKWQVSATGGIFPRWRQDGKEIFYRSPDNKLMAASVSGQGSSFDVGAVRPLFDVRPGGPFWFYDVAPDGQHFLVNTADEQTTSAPITLVVNWPAALKP